MFTIWYFLEKVCCLLILSRSVEVKHAWVQVRSWLLASLQQASFDIERAA